MTLYQEDNELASTAGIGRKWPVRLRRVSTKSGHSPSCPRSALLGRSRFAVTSRTAWLGAPA